MALKSDDSDIRETWLKCYFGGNGDIYVDTVYIDDNGNKRTTGVRIATSGGKAPVEVKVAAAQLARAMEQYGLNTHPNGKEE